MENTTKKEIILGILSLLLLLSTANFTYYNESSKKYEEINSEKPPSTQAVDNYLIANVSDQLWSPDGTKLAYIKSPSGLPYNCELWIADKDPSSSELINHNMISSEVEFNGLEDWYGDWILYRIRHEEGNPSSYYGRNELWKIRADGTGMTQITFSHTNGIRTSSAMWPNRGTVVWGRFIPGTNLVYFNAHNGNGWYRTYVCNDDGTDGWYDISYPDYTWRPALSPTGNRLLWGRQTDHDQPTTYKSCNVDGSDRVTIKAFSIRVSVIVLADGNTMIWSANDNIYAIDLNGANERTVLDDDQINIWYNYDPSNVQGLLMGSNRSDGNMHIYKINVDGTGIEQLTGGTYLDEYPNLSPDGNYLSYLRLPEDFDKGSSTVPYPYELVVKNLYPEVLELKNYNIVEHYTYNWIDASGGTELILSDDGYSTQSLPFAFQFYNDTFSTIYLGANGYLSFVDSSPSDYTNDAIPSADPDNYYLIAPFWDDLYPPDGGHIYVQDFGTYWVAEWLDIYHIDGNLLGSFEVILFDTGDIIFNYDYLDYTAGGYTCGLNLGMDTEYYTSYQELNDSTEDLSLLLTYQYIGFFDNFESGLSKWESITGLWNLTDTGSSWPDPCHSPTHAMWFGDEATGTFDTGSREYGELVSIPFSLAGYETASLEFYHWREGEGGSFDVSYIHISTNGINWDQIYSSSSYIAPWQKVSIDISAYVGYPSVQLKFYFDTLDSVYNAYRGWLLDDIFVRGFKFTHDLQVSLETPTKAEIGNSYIINATVSNNGMNDEYDVELFLSLDDVIVNSAYFPSFPVGASESISYTWTPPDYGIYNFTAYSPPLPYETDIVNNILTELKYVFESQLFDGMCTNYTMTYMDTEIGPSHFAYSYDSEYIFQGDWWFNLNGYDYHTYYDVNSTTRIMTNVGGSGFLKAGHHDPGWIFTEIFLGDNILIAYGISNEEHTFNVSSDLIYELPDGKLVNVWVLEDLNVSGGFAWYEKSTGILLKGAFFDFSGYNHYTLDFLDTNVIFEYFNFDHDLRVSLETPLNPEIGNSYIINATVFNNGLNDEYDVELFLYLDDVIVGSASIPSFPVGASETISYLWTPFEERNYNFTVYAPPVDDEEYIDNNIRTKQLLALFTGKISGPIAIFRNNLAWDMVTTDLILNNYGIDYTVYDSSQMGTVILSEYEKVIIESDQDQLFYDTLGDYISWFEAYAASGGILEIHACDDCWHGGTWDGLYLMPGGFSQNHTFVYNVSINLTTHPIVNRPYLITDEELSDSTIGYFDTFPSSSKQIIIDSSTLNPVFIELAYGEGTILITMQGLEWCYGNGYSNLLENVILYNPDAIAIITPDSSSQWETSRSEDITWTSTGTISNVKIELYKNDIFIMEIEASTPNDGSYTWVIPSGLEDSTQYQIKISDILYPATYDFCDYFEIFNPSITITSPESLTEWETGTSEQINWASRGTIYNVKIELYKDGIFIMEIEVSTPNYGSYTWVIPSGLEDSTQYQIKISDVSNPATYDFSEYFEIFNPSITIISPDDSCIWEVSITYLINWTSRGNISNVKLELYMDGDPVCEIIASTSNDGSYTWTIPSGLADDDDYQIKIIDALNPSTYSFSEEFEIFNPSITITSPDDSCIWEAYQSYFINWTSLGAVSNVKLELYKDGNFVAEIIVSTPNDGSYTWTIPSGLADDDDYQIKIIDALNPSTYSFSGEFEIFNPLITVMSPESSCSWECETSQYINWTSVGTISNVKLELYKDGVFVMQIEGSLTNTGVYNWTIPSGLDASTLYQIKVSHASNTVIYDFSEYFEIKEATGPPDFTMPLIIGLSVGAAVAVAAVITITVRRKRRV